MPRRRGARYRPAHDSDAAPRCRPRGARDLPARGLWYSPLLFGKRWQRACGLADDALGRGLGRIFVGSYLLALVAATNLAFFLGDGATVAWGATAGALAGFGWVATALG